MSVRREIPNYDGVYFITFTCARWLKLLELVNGYDLVYKWFNHLKGNGHFVTGYVIMPNHVHTLLAFRNTQGQSINAIIGTGKRFMAYEIVKRLNEQKNDEMLTLLTSYVNATERKRGKLHEVFEPLFDWKECLSATFIEQKLEYMHKNPCSGAWELASQPEEYIHSSAGYYASGEQGIYQVTNYMELQDVDLTKPWVG